MKLFKLFSLSAVIFAAGCQSKAGVAAAPTPSEVITATPTAKPTNVLDEFPNLPRKITPSGLEYQIIKPGAGPPCKKGMKLTFHYAGSLPDGTRFQNNFSHEPQTLTLGDGHSSLKGFDEGLLLNLKKGEVIRLIVPPKLGLGDKSNPPLIPANATLIFDIAVRDVSK